MCDDCGVRPGAVGSPTARALRASPTRRSFLLGAAATGLVWAGLHAVGGTRPASAGTPSIAPRSAWAGDAGPVGSLPVEAPGDVRVLVVHHTAGPNEYAPGDVPGILRGIHRFHTGPEKGWADVAYNFFVDRYGGVWEGRAGSLEAPVIGDATGGNQGYSQLCCFLGTFTDVLPTVEAQQAMVGLLAWLAERYGVDTVPGATTSFASRGSNKHPAGATVTTATIAGHRDLSLTACPGDAAYAWVRGALPAAVSAARTPDGAAAGPATAPSPPPPSTTAAAPGPSATTSHAAPTTAAPTTVASSTADVTSPAAPDAVEGAAPRPDRAAEAADGSTLVPWALGGALVAAALGGGAVLRSRRGDARRRPVEPAPDVEG